MKLQISMMMVLLALSVTAAEKPKVKPEVPGGLVSHYSFDTTEEGGWTPCAIDTNFNAKVSSVRWATAWNKSGYMLNGVSSKIVVKDHKRLKSPRFTISIHFKTYKVKEEKRIFLNKGLYKGYVFSILGSNDEQGINHGKLCFEIQGTRCLSDKSLADNAWYNAIITVDEKVARMYIDGKKQKSEALLKKHFTPVPDDLVVGMHANKFTEKGKKKTRGFEGSVDELMFFNRALTPKEAGDLFYCSIPHYSKKSVQWRIRDLDELLERKLITEDFRSRKLKELNTD